MKQLYFLALLMMLGFVACKHNHDHPHGEANQGKEYTSAYICPMHCKDSGSDMPGKCPVCGMDYKKNEKTTEAGHEGHDHDGENHEGHDHEGDGHGDDHDGKKHDHDGEEHDHEHGDDDKPVPQGSQHDNVNSDRNKAMNQ